jgi:transcriptional regulator with XRE-family HTH domain
LTPENPGPLEDPALPRGGTPGDYARRIDQSTISRIEKGQHWPSEDMKRRLAAALDQPIGTLFSYPDDVPPLPQAVAS